MHLFIRVTGFAVFTVMCFGMAYYSLTFLLQNINPSNPLQMKFAIAGYRLLRTFTCLSHYAIAKISPCAAPMG